MNACDGYNHANEDLKWDAPMERHFKLSLKSDR